MSEQPLLWAHPGYVHRLMIYTNQSRSTINKLLFSFSNTWGGQFKPAETCRFVRHMQYAQEKYAAKDLKATIVRSTMYYNYSDPYHYDSKGYIDLGIKFADAVYQLNRNP